MSDTARKAEANGTPAEIEYKGRTFTVPTEYDDFSIDFLEALEDGKAVGIIRGALGPDQWRIVKAMDLRARDLNELGELIAGAMGLTPGNSEPSSA